LTWPPTRGDDVVFDAQQIATGGGSDPSRFDVVFETGGAAVPSASNGAPSNAGIRRGVASGVGASGRPGLEALA